jgi:hypothetical protein
MKKFQALPPVLFKRTIKKVKRGKGIEKSPINVYDALPWEETDRKLKDLSLHPSIG